MLIVCTKYKTVNGWLEHWVRRVCVHSWSLFLNVINMLCNKGPSEHYTTFLWGAGEESPTEVYLTFGWYWSRMLCVNAHFTSYFPKIEVIEESYVLRGFSRLSHTGIRATSLFSWSEKEGKKHHICISEDDMGQIKKGYSWTLTQHNFLLSPSFMEPLDPGHPDPVNCNEQ